MDDSRGLPGAEEDEIVSGHEHAASPPERVRNADCRPQPGSSSRPNPDGAQGRAPAAGMVQELLPRCTTNRRPWLTCRSNRQPLRARAILSNVTHYVTIGNMKREVIPLRAPQAADWALAHGRSALTTEELAQLLFVPESQVRRRLHAPAQRGEWVTPVRGLWIPVPPEFRTWGAPPGIEVIDAMMSHLNIGYYVGWLSAAGLYGAAHQAPQVFQVAVDRQVRDRTVGRTRFQFAQRDVQKIPVASFPTRAGTVRVSSIAATALDVATDIGRAGGLDNAATVICELAELDAFQVDEIAHLAGTYPISATRRVGYILENFGDLDEATVLRESVEGSSPSRLDPSGPASGPVDRTWLLYLNRTVEPDL